jgi:thiamine pyrophosphate-dependent acetolactate synthase large subunit-like protein
VIGLVGDADFYYHMTEMKAAARCGLNAVMVANNNFSGGASESAAGKNGVNIA